MADTIMQREDLLQALEWKARTVAWIHNRHALGLHYSGIVDFRARGIFNEVVGREDFSALPDGLYDDFERPPRFERDGWIIYSWPWCWVGFKPYPAASSQPHVELLPPVVLSTHTVGGYREAIPNPDDTERSVNISHGGSRAVTDKSNWGLEASLSFETKFTYQIGESKITAGIKASTGGESSITDADSDGTSYSGVVPPHTRRTFARIDTIERVRQTMRVTADLDMAIQAVSQNDYRREWASVEEFVQCLSGVGTPVDGRDNAAGFWSVHRPADNWGPPPGTEGSAGRYPWHDVASCITALRAPVSATVETAHEFDASRGHEWSVSDEPLG